MHYVDKIALKEDFLEYQHDKLTKASHIIELLIAFGMLLLLMLSFVYPMIISEYGY